MKKIKLLILFIALSAAPVFAQNTGKDVIKEGEIQKYTVLETTFDYAPIREEAYRNSKRFTHLRRGVTIFANRYNSEFYKVDLGLHQPYWIEKRYVECEGSTFEKKGAKVSKIKFYQNKENYLVKIKTPVQTPYKISQTSDGLNFNLYNAAVKPNAGIKFKNTKDKFTYSVNPDTTGGEILAVNFKTKAPIYGYDVLKENNALILKIRKPLEIDKKKPLKGIKIALDAGHGGREAGVVSGGYAEKDVNLQITKKLSSTLKKRGAKTVLTRKKDVNTGLYKRVDIARKKKADFLISIHQNSLPNPKNYEKKHGSGVYYYNENAKSLAYSVLKNLTASTGFKNDGVFNASFALNRSTDPVSILVECGYLIHPYEREKLTDKKFQKEVAKGVANGIEEYLRNQRL